MEIKQKYYLANYATPAELITRLAEGREYLLNKGKKILLFEIPHVLQREWLDGNPETKHLEKIERIWDLPVIDGEEACIVYTPIDLIYGKGGENLESKES